MLKNIFLFITILLFGTSSLVAQTVPPPTSNSCIGPQGQLKWYYYNDVERTTLDYLYVNHNYPQGPAGFQYITNTDSPRRFNDFMGSLIKGYFTVPETGIYEFNVLGDDRVDFYLSSDDNPSNVELEVSLTGATGRTGFYARPESISLPISLQADTYYYFEIHHKEQTGDDYARLYWQTPSMANTDWQIIPVNHIYEYLCDNICLPAGTICDDGDANTTDDKEDGACNCIGNQPSTLECVGRQGVLQALTWTNIPGSNLDNLYADPSYPLMPDFVSFIEDFKHLSQYPNNILDSFGLVVKTYLTVPVTGNYQFNVTADDRATVYLSSDEEPFNKLLICNSVGGNNIFEYDEYPEQTSTIIPLIAGQYYYMEVHYKENANSNRYHVYWKTPFYADGNWRVVPTRYLYEYDCETACLPDNTPCDDKDASTYDDRISNCACAGIPCPAGDCTELETYIPFDACDYTNEHSTSQGNSWLSCALSANPNPERGMSHWILYDFDQVYSFNESTIYNYNVAGNTGAGIKDFVLDYSLNGTDWTELAAFQLPQASGTSSYAGVIGPALNGIAAQYILITPLTVWNNGSCAGFSEIIFDAETCPNAGTTCDDGDATTNDDRYDAYCNCAGIGIPTNDCTVDTITLADNPAQSKTYSAIKLVESSLLVDEFANTNFVAGEEISLLPGFETQLGANFCATIIACSGTSNLQVKEELKSSTKEEKTNDFSLDGLFIHHSVYEDLIYFKLEKQGLKKAQLRITNFSGKVLKEKTFSTLQGLLEDKIDTNNFPIGVYTISIQTNNQYFTKRIVIE